jgi:hypothetical protein
MVSDTEKRLKALKVTGKNDAIRRSLLSKIEENKVKKENMKLFTSDVNDWIDSF